MLRRVISVGVGLLAAGGIAWADAGDCLAIWVDAQGQPAECRSVDMREQLDHQPDVCLAESGKKAAIRVKLTACMEGPKAAIPTPGAVVIQYVVDAQVTKGKVSRQLTGKGNGSWDKAVAELCRAIVSWSGEQESEHR